MSAKTNFKRANYEPAAQAYSEDTLDDLWLALRSAQARNTCLILINSPVLDISKAFKLVDIGDNMCIFASAHSVEYMTVRDVSDKDWIWSQLRLIKPSEMQALKASIKDSLDVPVSVIHLDQKEYFVASINGAGVATPLMRAPALRVS